MSASLFDADDDGKPEIVFYNGYRRRRAHHRASWTTLRTIGDGQAIERGEHVGATALGIENMAAHPGAGGAAS